MSEDLTTIPEPVEAKQWDRDRLERTIQGGIAAGVALYAGLQSNSSEVGLLALTSTFVATEALKAGSYSLYDRVKNTVVNTGKNVSMFASVVTGTLGDIKSSLEVDINEIGMKLPVSRKSFEQQKALNVDQSEMLEAYKAAYEQQQLYVEDLRSALEQHGVTRIDQDALVTWYRKERARAAQPRIKRWSESAIPRGGTRRK